MTSKTYYGKLDCLTNTSAESAVNETYRSFCDFMAYLTQSNVASLVAWNSGSGVISASFNQRGFWDQSNTFGQGAHSVWKFPSSSTRPFDWYLYTQVVSGSAAMQFSFNVPISGYGATTDNLANNASARGIIMQAAVCFSGSTSFNPWNGGGITDGQSTAANPRWVPGAAGRTMYVLPRSNEFGGTSPMPTQKSNAICLLGLASTTQKIRYNFIFDGDALLCLCNDITTNGTANYGISYVGPFELRSALSGSGICSSSFGFTMYSTPGGFSSLSSNTLNFATAIGDTAGSTTSTNGGIAAPVGGVASTQPGSGSKIGYCDTVATLVNITFQASTYTGQVDEFPIILAGNEVPTIGVLGTFNSGLLRVAGNGVQSQDVNGDNSRAVFGGNTTIANSNLKITTPWSGSTGPGIGLTRLGTNFTWTKDYG